MDQKLVDQITEDANKLARFYGIDPIIRAVDGYLSIASRDNLKYSRFRIPEDPTEYKDFLISSFISFNNG